MPCNCGGSGAPVQRIGVRASNKPTRSPHAVQHPDKPIVTRIRPQRSSSGDK